MINRIGCCIESAEDLVLGNLYQVVQEKPFGVMMLGWGCFDVILADISKFWFFRNPKIGDEVVCIQPKDQPPVYMPYIAMFEKGKTYKVTKLHDDDFIFVDGAYIASCRFKPVCEKVVCPDCKGTGLYVGFIKVEPCRSCVK